MEEKRRARRNMRRARSYSLLSSTCETTDVSMAIRYQTVPLTIDSNRPLGLNVLLRESADKVDIYVSTIEPGLYERRRRQTKKRGGKIGSLAVFRVDCRS